MTPREFPIEVVLTVTTGRLLCPISDLYGVLDFMTGESLFTHQLPRASRECEGPILAQHPDLAEIVVPESLHSEQGVADWLAEVTPRYGTHRTLTPLRGEDHTSIDPIEELRMMRPDLPIVVIAPEA